VGGGGPPTQRAFYRGKKPKKNPDPRRGKVSARKKKTRLVFGGHFFERAPVVFPPIFPKKNRGLFCEALVFLGLFGRGKKKKIFPGLPRDKTCFWGGGKSGLCGKGKAPRERRGPISFVKKKRIVSPTVWVFWLGGGGRPKRGMVELGGGGAGLWGRGLFGQKGGGGGFNLPKCFFLGHSKRKKGRGGGGKKTQGRGRGAGKKKKPRFFRGSKQGSHQILGFTSFFTPVGKKKGGRAWGHKKKTGGGPLPPAGCRFRPFCFCFLKKKKQKNKKTSHEKPFILGEPPTPPKKKFWEKEKTGARAVCVFLFVFFFATGATLETKKLKGGGGGETFVEKT